MTADNVTAAALLAHVAENQLQNRKIRVLEVPVLCWVIPNAQTTVAGLVLARSVAIWMICAAGIPVTSAVFSGVHFSASAFISSIA